MRRRRRDTVAKVIFGHAHLHRIDVRSNMALAPLVYDDLRYDPVRDLIPMGRFARIPWVAAVNSKLSLNFFQQLIDYGRVHTGELTFADLTTAAQLVVEMVRYRKLVEQTGLGISAQ